MNTLKMKVLLIIANNHLWQSVRHAFLIWFVTGIIGCTFVYVLESAIPPWESYVLSLLFSSPAIMLAVLVLYFLPSFLTIRARIGFAMIGILSACLIIIGLVSIVFRIPYSVVTITLLPFIPSATFCFFFIARKQFLYTYSTNQ